MGVEPGYGLRYLFSLLPDSLRLFQHYPGPPWEIIQEGTSPRRRGLISQTPTIQGKYIPFFEVLYRGLRIWTEKPDRLYPISKELQAVGDLRRMGKDVQDTSPEAELSRGLHHGYTLEAPIHQPPYHLLLPQVLSYYHLQGVFCEVSWWWQLLEEGLDRADDNLSTGVRCGPDTRMRWVFWK